MKRIVLYISAGLNLVFALLLIILGSALLNLEKREAEDRIKKVAEQKSLTLSSSLELEEVKSFLEKGLSPLEAEELVAWSLDQIIRDDWDKDTLVFWYKRMADYLSQTIKRRILGRANCPESLYLEAMQEDSEMIGRYMVDHLNSRLPLKVKRYLATYHPVPRIRAAAFRQFKDELPLELVIKRYYADRWPVVTESILLTYNLPLKLYFHAAKNIYHPRIVRGLVKAEVPEEVIQELAQTKIVRVRATVARNVRYPRVLLKLAQDYHPFVFMAILGNPAAPPKAVAIAGERTIKVYEKYEKGQSRFYPAFAIEDLLLHENTPLQLREEAFKIMSKQYSSLESIPAVAQRIIRWRGVKEGSKVYNFLKSKIKEVD